MNRLLQHAFAERAATEPEATAVVAGRARLTYGELETASNRLAQLLHDAGCLRGDRVGVLGPKEPRAVVAIFGILKAGAAYVPLDADEPPARLGRTLGAAACRWLLVAGIDPKALEDAFAAAGLAEPPLIGWLGDSPPARSVPVVFSRDDVDAFPDAPPKVPGRTRDLAQILFTSGSTGTPKGVMIAHRTILSFLDWAVGHFGIDATDRLSQHAPLRFDLATFDVFAALSTGASLHMVPPELNLLPHKLARFIREQRLTQWLSVPSVLNHMARFDVIQENDFPMLRRVMFAGDVLPTPALRHWMQHVPHATFTNMYGPTETTIVSSYHTIERIPDESEPIPIGRPCAGEELLLLDGTRRPVSEGEVGEIYIRGAGVAEGYWHDPERTDATFVADPAGPAGARMYRTGDLGRADSDGLVHFCGRADRQIKSRGYRIELGEVEAAVHLVDDVREAAVVAIDSEGFEGKLICCAWVPQSNAGIETRELRDRLARRLPAHMLPVRWMRCEALPKSATGKLDRLAVATDFSESEATRDAGAASRVSR